MHRTLSIIFLIFWLAGCNTPTADNPTSEQPDSETVTVAQSEPVEFTSQDVKEGEGEAFQEDGAFEATVKVWSDKFDGTPWGKGEIKLVMSPAFSPLPGMVKLAEGMKKGGVRRGTMSAKDLFGKVPPQARVKEDQPFYLEVTIDDVFEPQPLEQEVVQEGSGDWSASEGDKVRVHYTGWLKEFESDTVFDSSRERQPFVVAVGANQVIPGWEMALPGMKEGEIKRIVVPHFLAYGSQDKGNIPPYSTLYFEMEMLGPVQEGELKITTQKEGQGEPVKKGDKLNVHYTGWLDSFDGEQTFDSSREREPFTLTVGSGQVIQGWDQGLIGMKPGEVRLLEIPYNLAYGPQGRPPKIPGYATLYFEVEHTGLAE